MKKPETLKELKKYSRKPRPFYKGELVEVLKLVEMKELKKMSVAYFLYALKKEMNPLKAWMKSLDLWDDKLDKPNKEFEKIKKELEK